MAGLFSVVPPGLLGGQCPPYIWSVPPLLRCEDSWFIIDSSFFRAVGFSRGLLAHADVCGLRRSHPVLNRADIRGTRRSHRVLIRADIRGTRRSHRVLIRAD